MNDDNNQFGDNIRMVSLNGDPERAAEELLAPSLWRVPLDQINLSTEHGKAELLNRFIAYPGKASLEKDEIIRFVERNRDSLPPFIDDVLPKMVQAAKKVKGEDSIAPLIEYFLEQVTHAYKGENDKIDVKSDRLFWLIYVLTTQLNARQIGYDEALAYLKKPNHKQRISSLTLTFMIDEFVELYETPNQPSIELLMLVGEAARLINNVRVAYMAFSIVLRIGTTDNPEYLLGYINNMETYLTEVSLIEGKETSLIERLRTRYAPRIEADDF